MNALRRLWQRFRAELDENPRLRAGTWAVIALVLFYSALVQQERVTQVHDDYAAQADRLQQARALLNREDWSDLLATEQAANQALEEQFWQAETQGLAQAQVQAALARIAEELSLKNVRIQPGLTQPVGEVAGLWRVQAQFSAAYAPGAALRVLHALATHPSNLVVDRLDLSRGSPRMVLLLSTYFAGLKTEPGVD